jgi:outer membrane lipopolysaccharide assembly protein LptE/RlpB
MKLVTAFTILIPLIATACGYRVAGRTSASLPNVRTIAIPTFQNQTFQFKIEQDLTAAVVHEFLTRTAYRVQSDTDGSDLTLQGSVTSISSGPIVFDPNTGRTARVLLTVGVRFSIIDTKTGAPLREATDLIFREPYELGANTRTYVPEDAPALQRISRDIAASLVSTVIESF